MRRIISTANTRDEPTRRIGSINLRAYPHPQDVKTPTPLLTNEVFAPTRDARNTFRRRFGVTLSMDTIETAVRAAYRGEMRDLCDILRETINTDPHLGSVLNKRFGGVSTLPWEVHPASGSGINDEKAAFYADVCREQLLNMKSFRKNMNQLAWAMFDGRACLENKWLEVGKADATSSAKFGRPKLALQSMEWIHPRRLTFGSRRQLRIQPENAVYIGGDFADTGLEADALPDKFTWWLPQHFNDYPEREGLGIRCMYWSFFKRFAARERMILSELFGKPWRIIEVDEDSTAGADELNAADEIVDSLGAAYTARMPRGTKLRVEQPQATAGKVHQEIIDESDKQISKLVLGQTGTTDGVPAGLNSSQASVMQDEQLGILMRDAGELGELIETKITDRIIALNFGENAVINAPRFKLRADLPADRLQELNRLTKTIEAGLPVTRAEAYEISGFSEPTADDVTVRVEQPPIPPLSPVAPAPRPVMVFPPGTSPATGEQQPAAPSASIDAGAALTPGSPVGAANAESTTTVNEDRSARSLGPLLTPDGQPDPRGDLTVAEFNKVLADAFSDEAATSDVETDAPDTVADTDTGTPVGDVEIAKQALNGAQVSAVLEIVQKFKMGEIEKSSAIELLTSSFPISKESATIIVGEPLSEQQRRSVLGLDDVAPVQPASAVATKQTADVELDRENVAEEIEDGESLFGEGGIHAHIINRVLEASALDGIHAHVFLMPDGSLRATQVDGAHMHGLQSVDADATLDDGEHAHVLVMPDGTPYKTSEGVEAAHVHRLQVDSTAVDGDHRHTIELEDPNNPLRRITVNSLTSAQYAIVQRKRAEIEEAEEHDHHDDGDDDDEGVSVQNDALQITPGIIIGIPPEDDAAQQVQDYIDEDLDPVGGFDDEQPRSPEEQVVDFISDEQQRDGFAEAPAPIASLQLFVKPMPNGRYRVIGEDSGKNFGEYDTREEAEDRLKEIERFATIDNFANPFTELMRATGDLELSVELAHAVVAHKRDGEQRKACCVELIAGQDQPESVDGSTEQIVNEHMPEVEAAEFSWARKFEIAVAGKGDAEDILQALIRARANLNLKTMATPLNKGLLSSAMLGSLDSARDLVGGDSNHDSVTDMVEESDAKVGITTTRIANMQRVLLGQRRVKLANPKGRFSGLPFADALRFFAGLGVMSKPQFSQMKVGVDQFAFTAAGITADETLRTLQDELVKTMSAGEDLFQFKNRIMPRLKDAGFVSKVGRLKDGKQALNPSHLETMFRTNSRTTYGTGRYQHQSDPKVVAVFPVWEIRVIKDKWTRPSHEKLHGTKLLSNDPFWKSAYPPFGYNCRCRVVSRGRQFVSKTTEGTGIRDIPDKDFKSGSQIMTIGQTTPPLTR